MYPHHDKLLISDRERKIIRIFLDNLPGLHPDKYFETDSSVFQCGTENLLFTTDEFSAEDHFRSHDPYALGWNVTAATLSDILAAGGIPRFYGHAVTVQKDWSEPFLKQFSRGVAQCLDSGKVEFLGGDVGMADVWNYTGIAIGQQAVKLNRRGAVEGDLIYMTGSAGAGNLEAALMLYAERKSLKPLLDKVTVRFPLRIREAEVLQHYARCCIDTSDGILRALLDLSRINAKGFRISHIPYRKDGLLACRLLGKPKELLVMGECGEYELLFTIPAEKEHALLAEAKEHNISFCKIGAVTTDESLWLEDGSKRLDLTGYALFARDFPNTGEYIRQLCEFVRNGKR